MILDYLFKKKFIISL